MEELKNKIAEVAQVLLNINVPVGLTDQVARPIRMCADRLVELSQPEKQEEPEEKPED